ncbi:hypothetical protein BJ878DRAFT_425997 [Calycina marina]|uniref:Rhodopsin domain-containing protein n=1 Tax=Calycina marina TaxID=1763456 RepID=A0A9P7Z049_9HELO|nr:hypothetical protein BJ878DRAFT_425997 [Calycina marina]
MIRVLARYLKISKKPLEGEDLAMYLAMSSFIVQNTLYLTAMPTLYEALDMQAGKIPFDETVLSKLPSMLKEFLAVLIFFWLTLWSVKLSLLLWLKKLVIGLPMYIRIWWCILGFVVVTYILCVVSDFTSCSSLTAWFIAGACYTPRDTSAKAISLWFSMAVDISTNLIIMIFPVRLIWNLQKPLREKIALVIIFSGGFFTIAFALVRTVSLEGTTTGGQVSTQWLILWGAIESMVSIIVGCLPSYAIVIRRRVEEVRARRNSQTWPATPVSADTPSFWSAGAYVAYQNNVANRASYTHSDSAYARNQARNSARISQSYQGPIAPQPLLGVCDSRDIEMAHNSMDGYSHQSFATNLGVDPDLGDNRI